MDSFSNIAFGILWLNLYVGINLEANMQKEKETIERLCEKQLVVVDYSDDDIIIIDNLKQLAEPNPMRTRMNLIAIAKCGKAQMKVNGQTFTLGESQLLVCPPSTMLTDFMGSPDFEFKAMFLSTRIIQGFLREKMHVWNEIMYVHKMHVVTMKPRDIQFFFSFYDAFRLIITSSREQYPYRSEVIQGMLRVVILVLSGALSTMIPAKGGQRPTPTLSLFQRFLDLLSKKSLKSHNVEDFASELCVSPKYLSVVCKKNSHKTAGQWIREHMLEEIRYYLKNTDLSMKQVADQLGFANPSFFGKYVKEHFGMTPLQFRQS